MAPIFIFTRFSLILIFVLFFCHLVNANELTRHTTADKYLGETNANNKLNVAHNLSKISHVNGMAFYINENATGNNDGTSWQNAYTDLTNALLYCAKGDTIRVAMGTYKPAGASFALRDGVVFLGGYSNTGNPTDEARNYAIYPTILSGEKGNPLYLFDNLSTIITGNMLQQGTVLDGFIIEKGYSNNTLQGVGINLWRSSPVIRNCIFRSNSSYNSAIGGSSIACQNNSNPTLINCFFINNFDFGFATIFIKTNCKPQLVNCVFAGNDGRFVVYANQSKPGITNCTFINNQIGTSVLPRDVRAGFIYAENESALSVSNSIFFNNKYKLSTDTTDISLNASTLAIVNCITQNYAGGNNSLLGINPKLRDINNIAGPDNFYFTPDDGLMPEHCSPAINMGTNAVDSAISTDILLQERIYHNKADIGAYEYQAGNGDVLLSKANDSIIANYEYTDQSGWTNYYKDCQLLLSIKKNGQQIGSINDGKFNVIIRTSPGYGTGIGNNLSQADYVAPAVYWSSLNRFWTINVTKQPADSVLIRLPWLEKDLADAKNINPAISSPEQLVFYTIDSTFVPLRIDSTENGFSAYYNHTAASAKSWKYSSIDTVRYAEFYVKKITSGGIGTGTGLHNGPYALPNNECQGGDKIFAATLTGTGFQWQVDKGNGFSNISDATPYSGTNSRLLKVIAPPTSCYGHKFRCLVTGIYPDAFTPEIVLKFIAEWKGTAGTAWTEAANWNCGIVPDGNTDVLIKSGKAFNPVINADMSCRSLKVSKNVIVTIASGKNLIITGK